MGAWLVHHGLMAHDGKTLQIQGHQGRALGKEGTVDVTVTIRDNQPDNVTISGQAVILFHAEWAITFNLCQARKSSRQKTIFPPPDGYQMQPLPRPAPPR